MLKLVSYKENEMLESAVREFHERLRVSATRPFPSDIASKYMEIADTLHKLAKQLEQHVGDPDGRALRVHLTLEETAEWLDALAIGDELAAFDALCDRLYVLIGDAVTYDLPLSSGFAEVHRSNMTKEKQPDDPSAERVRQKGPNYEPPNLREILEAHRKCAQ